MQNAQTCLVAKTLIDVDKLHSTILSNSGGCCMKILSLRLLVRGQDTASAFQDQIQVLPSWLHFCNRILSYYATIVFDVHIEIFVRQHAIPKVKE